MLRARRLRVVSQILDFVRLMGRYCNPLADLKRVNLRLRPIRYSADVWGLVHHPPFRRPICMSVAVRASSRSIVDTMANNSEGRRGTGPAEAYLKGVGERVRVGRARRGMSRRSLSVASGVSERYLAELERGSGNASLLVLRQIADALGIDVTALVSDQPERPIDLTLAMHQLGRLSATELAEARRIIAQRFPARGAFVDGRVALIGLRGAGKTTLGQLAAQQLAVPFIELDHEVERASGMELSEIFSTRGQPEFRKLERQCLEAIVQRFDSAVIAAGGSLVTEPSTFDLLLSTCFVVWLKATPDEHMDRVMRQGDLRPMSEGPQAMDDLKAILESRATLYAKADAVVATSGKSEKQAVSALIAAVKRGRKS
jgi:XRE family transcriptional regulator, aerobic/anaerobic benzoate catabolism transcriptional regulator